MINSISSIFIINHHLLSTPYQYTCPTLNGLCLSLSQMSNSSTSVAAHSAQQQHHHHHHHHFCGPDPVTDQSHQQHHHYQSPGSYYSEAVSHPEHQVTASHQARCCKLCRCSNRLLTGIVITILPIAITSTLICVFMMQKTNLHQYAIYSFVIFCVAFVFPFALFFFTVILNKIYKFYKREIRSNPSNNVSTPNSENCDSESGQLSSNGYSIQPAGSGLMSTSRSSMVRGLMPANGTAHSPNNQTASLICYTSRAYPHPCYYQIEDGTIVAYTPENTLLVEDSPPSYEMALLCPSVTHHQYPSSFVNPSIQVMLPKDHQKEKQTLQSKSAECGSQINAPEQDSIAEHAETNMEPENSEHEQSQHGNKIDSHVEVDPNAEIKDSVPSQNQIDK